MNGGVEFEKRLRRVPPRQVPAPWREEILGAVAQITRVSLAPRPGIGNFLRAFLWPNPQAWASLGAAWVLILGLSLASQDLRPPRTETADRLVRPSPQMRELLRQQEQLMAELSDPVDLSERRKSEAVVPKPQSCLQPKTYNA
jgi:hypothetical protein